MKIKENTLRKLISESIKRHLLNEYGNTWDYPGDSDFRSDAPWNQSEPEYETEEHEEVVPSIPFILVMVDETYDSSTPELLEQIKQLLTQYGCPSQIKIVTTETKEDLGWEEPDEDGYSFKNYGEPEINVEMVFVDENGKALNIQSWFDSLGQQNKQLADILSYAYTSFSDTYSDMSGYTDDTANEFFTDLQNKINQYS